MGCRLAITRSLFLLVVVHHPGLAAHWDPLTLLLSAASTSSVQAASTLPGKRPEGWKQLCCHFQGKERSMD